MVIVEICGPSCSGKSTLKETILQTHGHVNDISVLLPFSKLNDTPLTNVLREIYLILRFPITTVRLLVKFLYSAKINFLQHGSVSLIRSYIRKSLIYRYLSKNYRGNIDGIYLFDEGFHQLQINLIGFCDECDVHELKPSYIVPSKIIFLDSSLSNLIYRFSQRNDKPRRTKRYSKLQIINYLSASRSKFLNQFTDQKIRTSDIRNFSIEEVIQSEEKIWSVSN